MARGNAAVLTVKILTDASSVPGGLATAAASYGKFASAVGAKSTTAGTKAGDALVGGIDKALGTGLKIVGGVGAAILGTAFVKGFQRLNAIDQARAKLTGLGHDAKSVQQIMDNALASVKGTAFGLGEAATVAAQITAAGVKPGKDLEATLKLVADSATIAGRSMDDMGAIWSKVAASNKVQGDVINQLTDAGIPILQLLAKHYGVTAEAASKMVSAGKVDFAAFSAAMKDGLGGAAQESGKTFKGALDNVMAAVGRIGANLLGPLFEGSKSGLQGLPELLAPVEDAAKGVGQALADVAKWAAENTGLLKTLAAVAASVVGVLLTFRAVVAVMQAYRAVMAVVKAVQIGYAAASYGMAAATYAGTAATLAQNIALVAGKAAFLAVTVATKIAAAAQWVWNAALSANPIGIIIALVAALVAGLIWFFTQTKIGQQIWAAFVGFLKSTTQAVVSWFQSTWAKVSNFFKLVVIGWQIIISAVFAAIRGIVGAVTGWFQAQWNRVSSFFRLVVLGWSIIFSTVFATIRRIVQGVTSWFGSAWSSAVNAVKGVLGTLGGVFSKIFGAILKPIHAVSDAISGVVGWVQDLIGWLSRIKIPNLSGVGKAAASAGAQSAPGVRGPLAAAALPGAPRVASRGGSGSSTSASSGGLTIVIQGGLDSSDAIARRVQQVVGGRQNRTRGVVAPLRVAT